MNYIIIKNNIITINFKEKELLIEIVLNQKDDSTLINEVLTEITKLNSNYNIFGEDYLQKYSETSIGKYRIININCDDKQDYNNQIKILEKQLVNQVCYIKI